MPDANIRAPSKPSASGFMTQRVLANKSIMVLLLCAQNPHQGTGDTAWARSIHGIPQHHSIDQTGQYWWKPWTQPISLYAAVHEKLLTTSRWMSAQDALLQQDSEREDIRLAGKCLPAGLLGRKEASRPPS